MPSVHWKSNLRQVGDSKNAVLRCGDGSGIHVFVGRNLTAMLVVTGTGKQTWMGFCSVGVANDLSAVSSHHFRCAAT